MRLWKGKKEKKDNRKFNVQGQIDELTLNENKALTQAINIESNVELVQNIIDLIQSSVKNKISFNKIQENVKLQFKDFNEIKIDHTGLVIDGITLDYNISAYNNVSKIFSEKKKYHQKKVRASEIAQNMTQIDKKNEKKEKLIVNRKILKFENFLKKTCFLCLCNPSNMRSWQFLNVCLKSLWITIKPYL